MRHRFAEEVHISLIVRQVWCQVNRRRLYENHELYFGRRVLTVLIIKLQWQLRLIRNKREFNTVLGDEHCGEDENNAIVPVWPSAELDRSSSADGRADRAFDPARPSAQLVACSVQLGHPSSWTVCFLVPGFVSFWNLRSRDFTESVSRRSPRGYMILDIDFEITVFNPNKTLGVN